MTNNKQLTTLLDTIERNLTDWIPIGVKELRVKSPAYCLFLWYQDFSDDFTPHCGIATQDLLDSIHSTDLQDPLEKFEIIWRPQQCADLEVPGRLILDECDIVENEVESCYEILAEQSGLFGDSDSIEESDDEELDADLEEDDLDREGDEEDDEEAIEREFEALAPFREMMHRVGNNLRKVDWKKILPVTDDFVVLVGDYVGYWLADDFEQSVSPEKIASLIERGMLMAPLDGK